VRAIIFANGSLSAPNKPEVRSEQGDLLIAADGGAHHIRACISGLPLVIGDLDSLPDSNRKHFATAPRS
jgi:thiamine pyrophosphokinase